MICVLLKIIKIFILVISHIIVVNESNDVYLKFIMFILLFILHIFLLPRRCNFLGKYRHLLQ